MPIQNPEAGRGEASETVQRLASSARIAWFATGGTQTERDRPAPPVVALPPPEGVRAIRGRGQVTVDWSPVAGVGGYLVHRGPGVDGPFVPVDHGPERVVGP